MWYFHTSKLAQCSESTIHGQKSTPPLSQMATYWFVIGWFDNQSTQKNKVRQAAKDVVKSEVYPQTYSS